jgi:hypothetical protein
MKLMMICGGGVANKVEEKAIGDRIKADTRNQIEVAQNNRSFASEHFAKSDTFQATVVVGENGRARERLRFVQLEPGNDGIDFREPGFGLVPTAVIGPERKFVAIESCKNGVFLPLYIYIHVAAKWAARRWVFGSICGVCEKRDRLGKPTGVEFATLF